MAISLIFFAADAFLFLPSERTRLSDPSDHLWRDKWTALRGPLAQIQMAGAGATGEGGGGGVGGFLFAPCSRELLGRDSK